MTSELMLIGALCGESAKLGLNVGMSDARPAAVFRTTARPPKWIAVGVSGEFFEWQDSDKRHPAADPAGAAALILKYLTR
jgi:hypothetical protein